MRIAINGFGRIGRMVLRAIQENNLDIQINQINDPMPFQSAAHLYRYDSTHQKIDFTHNETQSTFNIGQADIKYTSYKEITWENIDLVLECSGHYAKNPQTHLKQGAKRVLVSAPSKAADITCVYGINHEQINASHKIISNASCTTNCLAPIAYLINKNFKIQSGYMTTIHSYTNDQSLLDSPHSDLRRARSAAISMIPTSTGAAENIFEIIPSLSGKLKGSAIRVPTPNVSLIDFSFVTEKKMSIETVHTLFENESLNNTLSCSSEQLVSIDFNHSPYSAIVDLNQTCIANDTFGRVMAWYDNEWGFANRMCDMILHLKKSVI